MFLGQKFDIDKYVTSFCGAKQIFGENVLKFKFSMKICSPPLITRKQAKGEQAESLRLCCLVFVPHLKFSSLHKQNDKADKVTWKTGEI